MKLKGKVALVTGSGRGIGRAIALEFAKEGASVVINCLHEENAKKVAKEVEELGCKALVATGDVSNPKDVKNMVDKTLKKFGKIDILVNNAGIVHFEALLNIKEETWDKILAVNLKGTFLCSQAVLKEMMKKKKGGKIINITSIAGKIGFPQLAHYCASKGGIIELTKEMAIEFAPHKININAIGPGLIETDMTKAILEDPKSKKQFLSAIPLGRPGKAEEIGKAALFLASSDSDYMTGTTIFVDGGWVAQ